MSLRLFFPRQKQSPHLQMIPVMMEDGIPFKLLFLLLKTLDVYLPPMN